MSITQANQSILSTTTLGTSHPPNRLNSTLSTRTSSVPASTRIPSSSAPISKSTLSSLSSISFTSYSGALQRHRLSKEKALPMLTSWSSIWSIRVCKMSVDSMMKPGCFLFTLRDRGFMWRCWGRLFVSRGGRCCRELGRSEWRHSKSRM